MATNEPENDEKWMTPREHGRNNHVYRCRSKRELATEALMKSWYGEELGALEIEDKQEREHEIADVLDSLFQTWDQHERAELRQIIEKWESIIGAEYARSTRPRRIANKILEIDVFNQAVKFKLNMVKNQLVKQIIDKIDCEITDVRFITGGSSTSRPS